MKNEDKSGDKAGSNKRKQQLWNGESKIFMKMTNIQYCLVASQRRKQ